MRLLRIKPGSREHRQLLNVEVRMRTAEPLHEQIKNADEPKNNQNQNFRLYHQILSVECREIEIMPGTSMKSKLAYGLKVQDGGVLAANKITRELRFV